MTWTCVVLLLICLVPYNDGFFAELFDSLEDLHLRFVSGTCYLLLDKTYYPGEFEMFVLTDIPTVDLYSWHFLSYDRQFHGTSYKLINLKCMRPGLKRVKFTIGYFGSRHYSPNAWCQRITPKPPLPTTLPVTTVPPSTTSATTLVAITTDTSTTTLGTTPTTTTIPASTTTTTPVSITTTTTRPVSTTTESTTSTSTTPIPTPTNPGLPSSSTPTQSTTVTTTLGPGPVRPSPS